MKKSEIHQPPCYFDRYIHLSDDIELTEAFAISVAELENLDLEQFSKVGNQVYAEGKWTINDIFQHLIDTEHILAYRALRIGRNDKTQLSGFDEALLAANVNTQNKSLERFVTELKVVRSATKYLFDSFDDEALQRNSVTYQSQMSTLALGFTIVGHQKYHLKIIAEKYLPLIK
jgi:DinB superfamily